MRRIDGGTPEPDGDPVESCERTLQQKRSHFMSGWHGGWVAASIVGLTTASRNRIQTAQQAEATLASAYGTCANSYARLEPQLHRPFDIHAASLYFSYRMQVC